MKHLKDYKMFEEHKELEFDYIGDGPIDSDDNVDSTDKEKQTEELEKKYEELENELYNYTYSLHKMIKDLIEDDDQLDEFMDDIEHYSVDFYNFTNEDYEYLYDKISKLINDPEDERLKELEHLLLAIQDISDELIDIEKDIYDLSDDKFRY